MSLRSPLGSVLGHGSAKEGPTHWWQQRITAFALVPLTLWFAFALLGLPSLDYPTVRAWIAGGWTAVFIVLLLLTLAWHSLLGVQVVVEDYVHGKASKVATLILSIFLHAIAAAAGVFAVLKIAFSTGIS
jgi:succinate dehydrogenase / fumarate reductase, membrane anchor subunit